MPQYLVIVESPSKAKTIKKYLGSSYKVVASMGHLRDLPKSQLGVDIENDFSPKYITIRGKGDLLSKLKKQAKASDKIFLATDPDREGEAISWHLANMLDEGQVKTLRVSFNEITKNAVKAAIKSPSKINLDLVEAQQARRILDRIVGYSISPILWKKIHKGLSAGRVQSVATRIIVDREREINDFVPKEYWTIDLHLYSESAKQVFTASLSSKKDGTKVELDCRKDVDDIISAIDSAEFIVDDVKIGTKLRNPAPPFTTSTMQQEASRKLNFTSKRTMMAAQRLYEGIDIPDIGTLGVITYMRTDSIRVSDEAASSVCTYIKENFGEQYSLKTPRVFKTKKGAQDAHEAIRPTDVNITPDKIKECNDVSLYKLYKLIWERFVASQMESAVYDTISAVISAGDYLFKASGAKLKFPGFRKVYVDSLESEKNEDNKMPLIVKDEKLKLEKICDEQHFTSPPPRFTEASLIKTMEEEGIGRPSTYASTISTILTRRYIIREGKSLIPTELGEIVTDIMKQYFSDIVDIDFTANMEQQLDEIEIGKRDRVHILKDFYGNFEMDVKKAEEEIGDLTVEDEVSDIPCDKCGRNMVYKTGRYGKFLACPGFPDCRNAKPVIVETGVNCPKCGARIIVRKSKRGKEYYGCENNPNCDFMLWNMPNGEKCPLCSSLMVKKNAKQDVFVCSNKECKSNEK